MAPFARRHDADRIAFKEKMSSKHKTVQALSSAAELKASLKAKAGVAFTSLKKAFRSLDTDKSGSLGVAEIQMMVENFGFATTPDQMRDLMMDLDPDGSGQVDYREFLKVFAEDISGTEEGGVGFDMQEQAAGKRTEFLEKMEKKHLKVQEATCVKDLKAKLKQKAGVAFTSLRKAFRSLDKDGSGALGYDEMRGMLNNFGFPATDETFAEFMLEMDPDKSGQVDYREFLTMFAEDITGGVETGGIGFDMQEQADSKRKAFLAKMESKHLQVSLIDTAAELRAKLSEKAGIQYTSIRRAFRKLDMDGNGTLGYPEVRKMLADFGYPATDQAFGEFMQALQ